MKKTNETNPSTNDIFAGFSNDEARKILERARVKTDRQQRKDNLVKLASNGDSNLIKIPVILFENTGSLITEAQGDTTSDEPTDR